MAGFVFALGWLIALLLCLQILPLYAFLNTHILTRKAAQFPVLAAFPKVSIIVPARNEGEKVRACLASLLNLNYPHFEIIAVNDRSSDETGAIMDELAQRDSRLHVIHIRELPAGWLGKNHAMHQGSEQASGELLLFSDGDTLFAPDTLQAAVRYLQHAEFDHFCLLPRLIPGDYWENALSALMALVFLVGSQPWSVTKQKSPAYGGVGQFNFIRRSVYQSIGGYAAMPLEVIDDMRLGYQVKRHGFKSDFLRGDDLLQIKWQSGGIVSLIKGVEKNSFAAIDFSLWKLFAYSAVLLCFLVLPYLSVIVYPDWRSSGMIAALLLLHGAMAYWACQVKISWQVTWGLPVAIVCCFIALWNSAWVTLRQGGVRWRDTFYAIDLLKRSKT